MTPRFRRGAKAALRTGGGGLTSTMDYTYRFASCSPTAEHSRQGLLGSKTIEFIPPITSVPRRSGRLAGFGLGFESAPASRFGAAGIASGNTAGGTQAPVLDRPKERQLIAIYRVQVQWTATASWLRKQVRTRVSRHLQLD